MAVAVPGLRRLTTDTFFPGAMLYTDDGTYAPNVGLNDSYAVDSPPWRVFDADPDTYLRVFDPATNVGGRGECHLMLPDDADHTQPVTVTARMRLSGWEPAYDPNFGGTMWMQLSNGTALYTEPVEGDDGVWTAQLTGVPRVLDFGSAPFDLDLRFGSWSWGSTWLEVFHIEVEYATLPTSHGAWGLRQRQRLTGTDSWPLRQRHNGSHAGSWPLRQRQTGI